MGQWSSQGAVLVQPATIHSPILESFNALARGDKLSVCEREWQGALVTSLTKKLADILVTDSRPVALLCFQILPLFENHGGQLRSCH